MMKKFSPVLFTLNSVLLIIFIFVKSVEASDSKPSGKPDKECTIDLPELMISLADKKEKKARFKEEKFLEILDEPLKSEGTLHYLAPDYMEKITTKPEMERLVVKKEVVSIFGEHDKSQTLSLDDYPALKELLNGIRFTLIGNLAALKKYYELNLKGNCNQWNLKLVPLTASVFGILDRIIILGKEDIIEKITWIELGGDYTVMTIEKERS
jgi:hypothetical protein